jgi:hypothetical protein
MKKAIGGALFCLLVSSVAFAAEPAKAQKKKLRAPTAKEQRLAKAYGKSKGFCCQMKGNCFDGPTDGSDVCKELGGQPSANAMCSKRECIDP